MVPAIVPAELVNGAVEDQPALADAARMAAGGDAEIAPVVEIAVERLEAEHDAPHPAAERDDEVADRRAEGDDRGGGAGGVGETDLADRPAVRQPAEGMDRHGFVQPDAHHS